MNINKTLISTSILSDGTVLWLKLYSSSSIGNTSSVLVKNQSLKETTTKNKLKDSSKDSKEQISNLGYYQCQTFKGFLISTLRSFYSKDLRLRQHFYADPVISASKPWLLQKCTLVQNHSVYKKISRALCNQPLGGTGNLLLLTEKTGP